MGICRFDNNLHPFLTRQAIHQQKKEIYSTQFSFIFFIIILCNIGAVRLILASNRQSLMGDSIWVELKVEQLSITVSLALLFVFDILLEIYL